MELIFDSHAHYYDERFDGDRDELLESLKDNGVGYVLGASSDMENSRMSVKLAEKYPFMYASVGIHPHDAKDFKPTDIDELIILSKHEKVVAIGETGLDYHYDYSPRDDQMRCFTELLELAIKLDMPAIIHSREAHLDTLNVLKKHKPRGVVHCYSGSAEMAREIVNLGMYIGLDGPVTFKNAVMPVEVAKTVPLERLLIETDCPYLAPVPFRGKRCDSTMLIHVAKKIAEARGTTADEIIAATRENAMRLFGIK